MSAFDEYHELAAQLLGRSEFPLPLPEWDRNYPHNVGLLSDAEESELAAKVLNHTTGMSFESWRLLNLEQRLPWMRMAVEHTTIAKEKSRLTKSNVLLSLAERVRANMPIIDADDTVAWPNGLLEELIANGTLKAAENAKSVTCDACGHDHVEKVEYIESPPSSGLRAYVSCPTNGRVPVSLARLRRWTVDSENAFASANQQATTTEKSDLPKHFTHTISVATEFLPTPSADDPKGLRDAAEYCRAQAAKLGDARAQWWWTQARIYDDSAAEAESRMQSETPKEPPSPVVDEPLSERAQHVLVAMLEMGALDSDHRQSTGSIAIRALGSGADANALKGVMSELKTREFVSSKTGSGGGCWLTEKGRTRAAKLRSA